MIESLESRIALNAAPVAFDDGPFDLHQGEMLNVSVLGNDTDADDDDLTAEMVTYPTNGYAMVDPDGSLLYMPNMGFVGQDSFTYRVFDGAAYSNSATVTIDVTNEIPVAVADSYTVHQGQFLDVNAPGLLANDSDPDNDSLTVEIVTYPTNGYVMANADGSFYYSPNSGFAGQDSFTYKLNDGQADSNIATVTINVTNTAPVADAQSFSVPYDQTHNGFLTGSDADVTDTLTFQVATYPAYGNLTLNSYSGEFSYSPFSPPVGPAYVGLDSFTFQVFDGQAYSAAATVNIAVIPTAAELYADYQLAVSLADQGYSDDVLVAAATRQTAINVARAAAQSDADSLDADYQNTVSQANQQYFAAVSSVEGAYQSAMQIADADNMSSYDQAQAAYETAVASAQGTYDSALAANDQVYQDAVAAAGVAYDTAVGPYQAALDQAVVNAQNAQAALNDAEADLSTATVVAAANRDAAHDAALVSFQNNQSQADQAHATAVDAADQIYQTALTAADAAYGGAVEPFQIARDQAYADYLANPEDPDAQTTLNDADAALSSAIAQATPDRDAAQAAALSTYQSALNAADNALISTQDAAAQTYQDALTVADDAYASTVSPYQTSRDQADAANQSAQVALDDASSALNSAIASATAERDADCASASASYESSVAAADQAWRAAEETAWNAFQASIVDANQAWNAAEDAAWNVYLSAKDDADAALAAAEDTAWTLYLSSAASLESNLASTEASLQSQFEVQVNGLLSSWQSAEETAWNSYLVNMANIPDAPPLGQRIVAPTAVEIPAVQGNPPVMLAMARIDLMIAPLILAQDSPIGLAAFLGRAYSVTNIFRGQVRTRVMAHIASTNRGADNYPETPIALIFLESGQTNLMRDLVTAEIARLNAGGPGVRHNGVPTVAAAMAGVTARIEYTVHNWPAASRSGNVDFRVNFTVTINSTTPAGAAATSTIRLTGSGIFHSVLLETRTGLVAPPP